MDDIVAIHERMTTLMQLQTIESCIHIVTAAGSIDEALTALHELKTNIEGKQND